MKIRLLSILAFFVLMLVFFCGCNCLDEANNQQSTNEVKTTYYSVLENTQDSTASAVTQEFTTESKVETPGEQVISSASEIVNSINSQGNSEPSETVTANSKENLHGEPEVNFSDLM